MCQQLTRLLCRSAAPPPELEEKAAVASPLGIPVIKEPPPPPPPRGTPSVLGSPSSAAIQPAVVSPSVKAGPGDVGAAGRAAAHGGGNAWAGTADENPGAVPATVVKSKPASVSALVNGQAIAAKTAAGIAGAPPPGLAPKATPAQVTSQPPQEGAAAVAVPVLEPGSLMMMLQDKRPHPFDGVWHRYACSRKTRASQPCPASYPRVPLAILDMPKFYSSIPKDNDLDLFTIFYLTPGTQYQYLAACELRQRNWRCATVALQPDS